jgi:hypothetical protein
MSIRSSLLGTALMALCTIALGQEAAARQNWFPQHASTAVLSFSVLATAEDDDRYVPEAIRIVNRASGQVVQEIELSGAMGMFRKPTELLSAVDADFDGHPDLVIPFGDGGAGPNSTNNFYLFNPRTKRYDYNAVLSEMTQVSINPNHTVSSASRGGCCQHSNETYRYIHGKLTLVASREENYTHDGKWIVTTTGKRVGGKMRFKTKRRPQPPDGS